MNDPVGAQPLTRREREVALLVAEGLTNREIAGRLFLSERTAEHHVEQIRNKLGFRSRTQIAAWVAERDLTGLQQSRGRTSSAPQTVATTAIPPGRRLLSRRFMVGAGSGVLVSLALALVGYLVFGSLANTSLPVITTVAGSGPDVGQVVEGHSGEGGAADRAVLSAPTSVAIAPDGSVYVAEGPNGIVQRFKVGGVITTVAGGGSQPPADGLPATQADLGSPAWVAMSSRGEVIFDADSSGSRGTVYELMSDGKLRPLADFGDPQGLAVAADGTVYVSDDATNEVWRLDLAGNRSIIAGSGEPGFSGSEVQTAVGTSLDQPLGLALNDRGQLYVADSANDCVRAVELSSYNFRSYSVAPRMTDVAGICGSDGAYAGDGGPAISARLDLPTAVSVGPAGTYYIADTGNNVVRQVLADGSIRTVAGDAIPGFGGDGKSASTAQLHDPAGLAYDHRYGLLIADSLNARIRRVRL